MLDLLPADARKETVEYASTCLEFVDLNVDLKKNVIRLLDPWSMAQLSMTNKTSKMLVKVTASQFLKERIGWYGTPQRSIKEYRNAMCFGSVRILGTTTWTLCSRIDGCKDHSWGRARGPFNKHKRERI